MLQSVWISALIAGLISSLSMPLGALTALIWTPKNRMLAFLIAFGSGALLAALVIDLVGDAREKGHLVELVVGSIAGSLFFTFVNQLVNQSGGFLRKTSTTLNYFNQQQSVRLTQNFNRLKKIKIFQHFTSNLRRLIAQKLLIGKFSKGAILYRQGDPSVNLYIIKAGAVELVDPQDKQKSLTVLKANESFGQLAFLTGCPHQAIAVVKQDCQLEILQRSDFEALLEISPELLERTQDILKQQTIRDYLFQEQGLSKEQIVNWTETAANTLEENRKLEPAKRLIQNKSEFFAIARSIRRFPIFSYLPEEELEMIAERLVYRERADGYVFFQPDEFSDRLYIIHKGEVEILYPSHLRQPPLVLSAQDPFGELSFLTGAPHTVTAIAKTDAAVWSLKSQDFKEILQQSTHLEASIKSFLEQPKIRDYLQTRQRLKSTKAANWIQKAIKSLDTERSIPTTTWINSMMEDHKAAPMAIWIGLLMDGIPEALTIGAHIVTHPISPSLLAGLFISNYPEALSSAEGMKQQGFSWSRILLMWTSIMLITGILSALGSQVFANTPESLISLLGSMAAGAMLTVIAETMLPEAYAKGGSIVGLSTLSGFLVIILIKSSF